MTSLLPERQQSYRESATFLYGFGHGECMERLMRSKPTQSRTARTEAKPIRVDAAENAQKRRVSCPH
jgi:hypothetical protein